MEYSLTLDGLVLVNRIKCLLVVAFFFVFTVNSIAQIDIYSGEITNASPNASYQLNIYSGDLELAEPGSTPQLNIHSGEMELAPPGSQYRLNIHNGELELGSPRRGSKYGQSSGKTNINKNSTNRVTKRRYNFD